MAGHHQWFTVKRLKGILDPKRGTLFGRLAKEITAASKVSGDDSGASTFVQRHSFEIAIERVAAQVLRLIAPFADGCGVQEVPVNRAAPEAVVTRIAV